jgi:hypothetical protein
LLFLSRRLSGCCRGLKQAQRTMMFVLTRLSRRVKQWAVI